MLTLALALTMHACAQQVRVTAPSTHATVATVSLYECGRRVAGPWRGRVGYRGLSARHREGDGTTPLGTFGLGPVLYGLAPDPGTAFRYHRLVCGDWWDEDPRSPTYNRFRHVRCGARPPFRGASEALWRVTGAYRLFAVVEYNARPAVPGRGSGIFLHVDDGHATNGCISLPERRLRLLLRRLRPGATVRVAA
jgi:L,D-peptidoglycan transpeptidase YkuD (ErfK/YbiS/YcfS/YnhG family)